MDNKEILSRVDHTLLRQTATWAEIQELCQEAAQFRTASVCIPPCYVRQAADYLQELCQSAETVGVSGTTSGTDGLPEASGTVSGVYGLLEASGAAPGTDGLPEVFRPAICTVIGFPNGNTTTGTKCYEAREALEAGAEELDMVINLGWVKEGRYDQVEEEIRRLKEVCGPHILKVIIETCLLSEEEKKELCQVVSRSGADYIKTSTGFSTAGATPEDIALFAAEVAPQVKIKAAGGIASFADAERFLELGADRLGTSRLVAIEKLRESERERAIRLERRRRKLEP